MNARLRLSLLTSLVSAALACSACGGDARELRTTDAAALVAAPAKLLAPEVPAAEVERRAFTPVVAPGEGVELAEESLSEKNERRKYEIDLIFPQLKGRLSPQAAGFNRAVRALVAREARDFRRTFGSPKNLARSEKKFGEDVSAFLTGRYEVIHLGDDFASVRFTLYGKGWVGRTIQHHRVLNFDLKSGRVLKLADLFEPGAQHLPALAANCVADLKRQDEEEHRREVARVTGEGKPASYAGVRTPDSTFQIGAGPEADNYRAWNLAAEGVLVSFATCRVGACADGEKEVLVPYSALAPILNEDGPAARLATRRPR